MFGKTMVEYARFERGILAGILVVGLVRLVLSLAGASIGVVKPVSMTVVALAGVAYCGVWTAARDFGSYRHLLPLLFLQAVIVHAVTILGIALAGLTDQANVFTAAEYSRLPNYLPHAAGHVAGMVAWPLVTWPVAALLMWATKTIRGGAASQARA